jgi:hypothetical protein
VNSLEGDQPGGRRRRWTPVRSGIAAALVALALAGCGIQPTQVIDAGDPARGIARGQTIYLVDFAWLRPVARETGSLGDLRSTLAALTRGPSAAEKSKGLTSHLPPGPVTAEDAELDGREGFVVTVPAAMEVGPKNLAVGQVVCTAAGWQAARGHDLDEVPVVVTNGRDRGGPYRCSDFARASRGDAVLPAQRR